MEWLLLYSELYSKRFKNPDKLIYYCRKSEEFWDAARDYAEEKLKKSKKWNWLSYRIDDFHSVVVNQLKKKVPGWHFKAVLGVGSMSKVINNSYKLVEWLFSRYISELKNLFDKRSKNYINLIVINNTLINAARDYTSIV